MEPLKFVALDPDDLEVVSTHLQDAEVKVADVHWRPQEKRLVVGLDRFDWQAWNASSPEMRRRRAALRFDRVLSCKCKQVAPCGKDTILNLLAVEFETDRHARRRRDAGVLGRSGAAARGRVPGGRAGRPRSGPGRETRPADPAEAPGVRH